MRTLILLLVALGGCEPGDGSKPPDDQEYLSEARIGPASAIRPLFEQRCEHLRVVGDGTRHPSEEDQEQNRKWERPTFSAQLDWECIDRISGTKVIASLYLSPGRLETAQLSTFRVERGERNATLGEALEVAGAFLDPLLSADQRRAFQAMSRRFPVWERFHGFRIGSIGVRMNRWEHPLSALEVYPATRAYAINMMETWADFERRDTKSVLEGRRGRE